MSNTKFTDAMDMEIADEVALMNPFKYGTSWEMVAEKLWNSPSQLCISVKSSKSFRDRAMLLMGKRKGVVAAQLKSSGMEEPPRTLLDIALDEVILHHDDAEVEKKEKKDKAKKINKKTKEAGEIIREAAMTGCREQRNGLDAAAPLLSTTADRPLTPEEMPILPARPGTPAQARPATPIADTPTGTANEATVFRGPKRRRHTSDLDRLFERQEQRDAGQLELQQKWRNLDNDVRQQQIDKQHEVRMSEIDLRRQELEDRRRQAEVEAALQRERLDMERTQHQEELRVRQEEAKNQNAVMLQMLRMLADKK